MAEAAGRQLQAQLRPVLQLPALGQALAHVSIAIEVLGDEGAIFDAQLVGQLAHLDPVEPGAVPGARRPGIGQQAGTLRMRVQFLEIMLRGAIGIYHMPLAHLRRLQSGAVWRSLAQCAAV